MMKNVRASGSAPPKNEVLANSARPPESDEFIAVFAMLSQSCSLHFQVTCPGIEGVKYFRIPLGCILLNTGVRLEWQHWFQHAPTLVLSLNESQTVLRHAYVLVKGEKKKKEPKGLSWRLCHCQWLSTSVPK